MRTYELNENATNYFDVEAEMITDFAAAAVGAMVTNKVFGDGKVTAIAGNTFDLMIMTIEFAEDTKRFQATAAIMTTKTMAFADEELVQLYADMYEKHLELSDLKRKADNQAEAEAKAQAKKQEEIKKAEAKAAAAKAKALKEFDDMSAKARAHLSVTNEFYYALGWLAKHVGSMTAILPDYLGTAFEKHFGVDMPKTLVDSRAKTSGGYAKQWSWEFKCTIKKLCETVVPPCIQDVTTDFSKGIHNTAFLWDLVENHGFTFGKKQDIDHIRSMVPSVHIEAFEEGFNA